VPFCWPGRSVIVNYIFLMMYHLYLFVTPYLGLESCHSMSLWWHRSAPIPGSIAQK
jgi:hypothetical protein